MIPNTVKFKVVCKDHENYTTKYLSIENKCFKKEPFLDVGVLFYILMNKTWDILNVQDGKKVSKWNQKLNECWCCLKIWDFGLSCNQLQNGCNEMQVCAPIEHDIYRLHLFRNIFFVISILGYKKRRYKHSQMHDCVSLAQNYSLKRFF